jgi:hypothetical protein
MKRQQQVLLIASTLAFSWLAMQAVHEFGHVVGAWLSGGEVAEVVLHPATISHTRLSANPHPLFVAWMGPVVGVALPVLTLLVARVCSITSRYLFQFFAAWCLVANGAYIAFGSLERVGDAGDMMRHGAPPLLLWLFGAITIPSGLWLWHGLGPHFGLGKRSGQVDPAAAYTMTALTVTIVTWELIRT